MGSKFFGMLLPDYNDLDNKTGKVPGFRVFIIENDGGVSLQMVPADKNPTTTKGFEVFLNVKEAKELVVGLQEAIQRAEPKNAKHKDRGQRC